MMIECGFASREIAAKIGCESHKLTTCTTAILLTKSIQVNEDIEVSAETIRKVLRKNGFAAREKRKKPLLSKKHREKRLDFAKRFKDWIVQDWSRVVFKIPNIWL
ncbi:unnamed protein product [Rhizophagus irregularis]|nr:unnamed protein product [Rhizophagus irregularis]